MRLHDCIEAVQTCKRLKLKGNRQRLHDCTDYRANGLKNLLKTIVCTIARLHPYGAVRRANARHFALAQRRHKR